MPHLHFDWHSERDMRARVGRRSGPPQVWLGCVCCCEADRDACAEFRPADLTNVTHGVLPDPAFAYRFGQRLRRRRTETGSERQFMRLVASGLAQTQSLKPDKLFPVAAVDDQGRRAFAAGEVERAALFAVETRCLSRIKHEANARR